MYSTHIQYYVQMILKKLIVELDEITILNCNLLYAMYILLYSERSLHEIPMCL